MTTTFFIDESGNPGVADSRHPYFIMVAIQITDKITRHLIDAEILQYKQELGWTFKQEFKFSHTKKDFVAEMIRRLKKHDYRIYAVVVNKNTNPFTDRRSVYNETLKLLLQLTENPNLNLVIDGQAGKKHRKNILTTLRQNLTPQQHIANLRFCDSKSSNLLQLADLVAGIIARLQNNPRDATPFYRLIKDKIITLEKI